MSSNSNLTLSYVLTTFNKLDYLKVVLPLLLNAMQNDEELIICDGGSTDGTNEYLSELFKQKKIQQYISEKDFGEAHGINKGIQMAKAELIKIITDDDVFSFKIIQDCKQFMLKNKEIDITGFDGYSCNLASDKVNFVASKYISGFKAWTKTKKPFLFCGLSFMIRKSSLPLLGYFHTKFKMVDLEYSLRVSSLKSKIAFHTGKGFIAISNPDSNSVKFHKQIEQERKIVNATYNPELNKINYKKIEYSLRLKLSNLKNKISSSKNNDKNNFLNKYLEVVEKGELQLKKHESEPFEILY